MREGVSGKESIFSFEDPAFYEKRDLGGVEVSVPKEGSFGRLFSGKRLSPEGRAFAQEFFKKITHEAPKEDQASLFEVVHSLLSDEGEEGVLKKLLHQSAKLRFKPLESKRNTLIEEKKVSFDDSSLYEKRSFGGVKVTFPKESVLEQLFAAKGFSEKGRQFAKHFFDEVMSEVPEWFDIQDIQVFFKTICDQLPQGGREGLLRKFLYQSARFRLEHVEKIKQVEELRASNSPLAGILKTLQTRYEKFPNTFSHNFIASSVVAAKKSLNKLGTDMIKRDGSILSDGMGRGVLSAFLEEKFTQALRERLEGGAPVTLREVVSGAMASLDAPSLSQEFRERSRHVPSLTAIQQAIVSSRVEESPAIVFEEPIKEVPLSQIVLDSRGIPRVRDEFVSEEDLEREEFKNEIGYFVQLRSRNLAQFVEELTEIEELSRPYNIGSGDYMDERLRGIRDRNYPDWEPKRFGSLFREILRRVGETEETFRNEKRMVDRVGVVPEESAVALTSEGVKTEAINVSEEIGESQESRNAPKKRGFLKRVLGDRIGTKVGLFIASAAVLFTTYGAEMQKTNTINQTPILPQDSGVARRVLTEERREIIKSMAVEKDYVHVGSYYYKFKGEANEKNKKVVLSVSVPRVDIDTTRWHNATGQEGFDKTGPMDRPSIYVGGSASGTEFEGGLSWDRVYTEEGRSTEEFAYRIFLRAPGVSSTGWINPQVGSKDNVYFRKGEKVELSMERRGSGMMALVVKGENRAPVELSFALPDTSYLSYKYVVAVDQFVENERTGLREGNEGRRAKPTKTTVSNLNIEHAHVELEGGEAQPLGFFSPYNTVIVPGDVVPPPFRISRVNPQTGAFSCTIDTQVPTIAGVGVVESQ